MFNDQELLWNKHANLIFGKAQTPITSICCGFVIYLSYNKLYHKSTTNKSATCGSILVQGRSQRGGHGWMSPPVMDWKKFLAPELQTDDFFATGVTRQTLLKPKENVQFQRWFFENFLGAMPPAPILGRGYGASPQTQPPQRSALHRRVPPYKKPKKKNPGYAPDTGVWT